MSALIIRLRDMRIVRYLLASAGALSVDMGTFLALLTLAVAPPLASAIAYCAGILAHWLMSSRAVFIGNVAARGAGRTRQKALFVGSALVGLAITTFIVWVGDMGHVDPRLSKLVAVAFSFSATWLLRSRIVFR